MITTILFLLFVNYNAEMGRREQQRQDEKVLRENVVSPF